MPLKPGARLGPDEIHVLLGFRGGIGEAYSGRNDVLKVISPSLVGALRSAAAAKSWPRPRGTGLLHIDFDCH